MVQIKEIGGNRDDRLRHHRRHGTVLKQKRNEEDKHPYHGQNWTCEQISKDQHVAIYHGAYETVCKYGDEKRRKKEKWHNYVFEKHSVPLIFLAITVILLLAIGLYLYAQITECRMSRHIMSKTCPL